MASDWDDDHDAHAAPAERDRPWRSLFWVLAFGGLLALWAWAKP